MFTLSLCVFFLLFLSVSETVGTAKGESLSSDDFSKAFDLCLHRLHMCLGTRSAVSQGTFEQTKAGVKSGKSGERLQ